MTAPGEELGADDPPQAAAEATIEVIEPIEPAPPDLFGIIQQEYYTGPVPHPEVLKGYEEVLPGSAERILSMAERQAAHRQAMERLGLRGAIRHTFAGTAAGLIIGVAGLYFAYKCAAIGQPVAGSIIGVADLGGIVGVFVLGRFRGDKTDDSAPLQEKPAKSDDRAPEATSSGKGVAKIARSSKGDAKPKLAAPFWTDAFPPGRA